MSFDGLKLKSKKYLWKRFLYHYDDNNSINVERFTGLNFHKFCGLRVLCEHFPVNTEL